MRVEGTGMLAGALCVGRHWPDHAWWRRDCGPADRAPGAFFGGVSRLGHHDDKIKIGITLSAHAHLVLTFPSKGGRCSVLSLAPLRLPNQRKIPVNSTVYRTYICAVVAEEFLKACRKDCIAYRRIRLSEGIFRRRFRVLVLPAGKQSSTERLPVRCP